LKSVAIDLMRRIGLFKEALKMIHKTTKLDVDPLVKKIIIFQEKLISVKDKERHTLDEVIKVPQTE